MESEASIYVEEVTLRENGVNTPYVRFLRTDDALWLAHVDIEGAVHALVFPSEPVVKTPLVNLKLAARFFLDVAEYQNTLEKVIADVFGEVGQITGRYVVRPGVSLGKSPYTRDGRPLEASEEMKKYREMDAMDNMAVVLPIAKLLASLKPPLK